jgi:hypothetical protein
MEVLAFTFLHSSFLPLSSSPKPFLPEILSSFLAVSPLALLHRALGTAELLAGAFDVEEVPTKRVRAHGNFARKKNCRLT